MIRFHIFVIRALLSVFSAILLARLFHPEWGVFPVAVLAVLLVGLAYLSEFWRHKKSRREWPTDK